METVLETFGLSKSYGAKKAVDNVSMRVFKGDIYGFIGSNGAGKTTFIRMIMGLINPTSGSLAINGKNDEKSLTAVRANIGSIVETPSLMLNMSARDCLNTQRLMYGIKDKSKIDELLGIVGLSDTGNKKVKDFSLGMKQRLSIAQALLNDPFLMMLDEPTNGMDPQGIIEIRELLYKLRDERGITILISSHILSELQQIATRFGIINNGQLIEEFTAGELEEKVVLGVTLKVDDIKKALKLTGSQFSFEEFFVPAEGMITVRDQRNFSKLNKLLVSNDVEVSIVSKDQFNLEKYFINKIGGNHNA